MERLGRALDEMGDAYQNARRVVFDQFPQSTAVDDPRLTAGQREALERLRAAEDAVRRYHHSVAPP